MDVEPQPARTVESVQILIGHVDPDEHRAVTVIEPPESVEFEHITLIVRSVLEQRGDLTVEWVEATDDLAQETLRRAFTVKGRAKSWTGDGDYVQLEGDA